MRNLSRFSNPFGLALFLLASFTGTLVACTPDDDESSAAARAAASQEASPPPSVQPTPINPVGRGNEGVPNQFVGFQGVFHVTTWDDRALTPEQKAADPSYNPAWVPFSECLAERGLEVRPDASQKFSQADLDRLLERLNKEYPDPDANKKFPFEATGKVSGDAGIFFDCAEAWLTKTPQEIHAITGVPNMWSP